MFITAELLIEYAIRIGTNDIMQDLSILDDLFKADKLLHQGKDLTPPGSTDPVFEQLIMDEFQAKLATIPRKQGETPFQDIFQNSMPTVEDVKKYLSTAALSIIHGFPRQPNDLPTISITLGGEDEEQYVGAKFRSVGPDGKEYWNVGSDLSAQYHISVISTNYDEVLIWYHLIKYSLWRYRHAIEAYGFRQTGFTWMDVEPAQDYLQAGLFVYQRSCILRGEKEENVTVRTTGYSQLTSILDSSSGGEVAYSTEKPIT